MIKFLRICSLLLICVVFNANAQNTKLAIDHKLHQDPFSFGLQSSNNLNNGFNVSRLEYYITTMKVIHDGGKETVVEDFVYLVDASKNDSIDLGEINATNIEGIEFYVGVDVNRNHLDPSKYDVSHPLAPKEPSMHWGWASGYRFVAIEGMSGEALDKKWEIHSLGDNSYFPVRLMTGSQDVNGTKIITIKANYAMALQNINVKSAPVIHGETGESKVLLQNFRKEVFRTATGEMNALGIGNLSKTIRIDVYPNPSQNGLFNLNLNSNEFLNNGYYQVIDVTGKIIIEKSPLTNQIFLKKSGIYFLQLTETDGEFQVVKLVVQ